MKQLSEAEIKQFIQTGFLVAREVFSRDLASAILPRVWSALRLDPNNPATWPGSFVILKEIFFDEPISQVFTPRYFEIVDDLCGAGRWKASMGLGHWPVSFPDFSRAPWTPSEKWHIDNCYSQYASPPVLGLVAFHLFSDIGPGDGGTAIRVGSHRYAARILAGSGHGNLEPLEFSRQAVDATKHLPCEEAKGQAGDVLFLHPLTVHSTSVNHSDHIRVLAHKIFDLREPMNLERNNLSDFSPVEIAIV